ncbi:hypothetical protein [Denitratisoma sp. DHT3]|nr:hypothetical protein [Denitratisoma sp. DHT3]
MASPLVCMEYGLDRIPAGKGRIVPVNGLLLRHRSLSDKRRQNVLQEE